MFLRSRYVETFSLCLFICIFSFRIWGDETINVEVYDAFIEETLSSYLPDMVWVKFKKIQKVDNAENNSIDVKAIIKSKGHSQKVFFDKSIIGGYEKGTWLVVLSHNIEPGEKITISNEKIQKEIIRSKSNVESNITNDKLLTSLAKVYCNNIFWRDPRGAFKVVNIELDRNLLFDSLVNDKSIRKNECEYNFAKLCKAVFLIYDINKKYKHGRNQEEAKNDDRINNCRVLLKDLINSKFSFISQYSCFFLGFLEAITGNYEDSKIYLENFDKNKKIWEISKVCNKLKSELQQIKR